MGNNENYEENLPKFPNFIKRGDNKLSEISFKSQKKV